jgi:hypothetical protein
MLLMFPSPDAETGKLPDAKTVEAMMKYNAEMAKAGILLALDGLQSSAKGARVRFSTTGKASVSDGPFSESKEIVGGYWMIQVKSKEEALEWAKRCPVTDEQTMVEVRQVFEMTDFGPDVQKVAETSPDFEAVKAAVA